MQTLGCPSWTVHRASLHAVDGAVALAAHDPGGLEVLDSDAAAFDRALKQANHTLERSLTDPRVFSGIGNAYSDEILHAARLSPFRMSQSLSVDESRRLFETACATLREWTDRLRGQAGGEFPAKVTAFHDEMAVHGHLRAHPSGGSGSGALPPHLAGRVARPGNASANTNCFRASRALRSAPCR